MIVPLMKNSDLYNKAKEYVSLRFIDCGHIYAPDNWVHKRRFLNHYEMIYVVSGTLFLKIDNEPATLSENEVYIIPPYKTLEGAKQCSGEISFFRLDFMSDNPKFFGIDIMQESGEQPLKIVGLFEEMISLCRDKNSASHLKDAYLYILFHQVKKVGNSAVRGRSIAQKACKYVEINISKPLTAAAVADALNYNKDYLSRSIKQYCGASLKDYINTQKIMLAKKLLASSNYSVSDIAELIGYDDGNLFTKFFKYHEKMSPVEYRNRYA